MAQIIDMNNSLNRLKINEVQPKFQKVGNSRIHKFRKTLQEFLSGSSNVYQFIAKKYNYFEIILTSKDNMTDSVRHHHISINFQGQQMSTKFYFLKNNIMSNVYTQQKRINLFRILLKLKKYSYIKVAIDPFNGCLFGYITVKIREITDFKFILKQLIRCQYSISNIMTMILNYTNAFPMKLLDAYAQKKQKNVSIFLQNQNKIAKKITRLLNFSEEQIKMNQNSYQIQSLFFDQIIEQIKLQQNYNFLQDSILLFEHDQKQLQKKSNQKYVKLSNEDQQSLLSNIITNSSSFNKKVYSGCQIQNSQVMQIGDSNLKGGGHKILVAKVYMKYIVPQKILNKFQFKIVAIKEPLQLSQRTLKKSMNEIQILKKLSKGECPYFLKYYSSSQQDFRYKNRVLMDFVFQSQSLTKYLFNNNQTLSIPMKLFLLTKVIQGLYFLHHNQVVHMDMSSGNILISKMSSIKVIDFGQSYHKSVYPDKKHQPGFTLPFTPPERFQNRDYTSKYDIYSYVIILFKAIFSIFPYNKTPRLLETLKNGDIRKKIFLSPEACNYECYQKIMNIIFSIINKGISIDKQRRHHSSSLVFIMKQIFYWFEEYCDLSYNN